VPKITALILILQPELGPYVLTTNNKCKIGGKR